MSIIIQRTPCICGAHRVRGKRYADTSRRPEAVQSREKTNRKPRSVCLSYTLAHSHSFSTYLALYLSFSPSFVNIRSREGGKRTDRSICQYQLPIFHAVHLYISRIYFTVVKITRRDTTSEIHALIVTKTLFHCHCFATVRR